MNGQIATYRTINDSNPIEAIMSMIERRAPALMKQNGGSLQRETAWSGRHLEDVDRAAIKRLERKGKTIAEIAKATGWSFRTVWKVINGKSAHKATRRFGGGHEY